MADINYSANLKIDGFLRPLLTSAVLCNKRGRYASSATERKESLVTEYVESISP